MRLLAFSLLALMASCTSTYNISMSHTSGGSTDTMEETATETPTNTVSPSLSIPAAAL